MCLILLALQQHPDYPLIIAANRDEFYQRPTRPMHWWPQQPVLAGQDITAGGSWMAINRQGRFAALTNYRETSPASSNTSRGALPLQWLNHEGDLPAFRQQLTATPYAGFNLLFGNIANGQLFHLSNRHSALTPLDNGIHGLSNALLDTPWPKITSATPVIRSLCQQAFVVEDWFSLLASRQQGDDAQLPDTGIGLASERLLSPRFIHSNDYGTRSSTVVAVDRQQRIQVWERSFTADGLPSATRGFHFQIKGS